MELTSGLGYQILLATLSIQVVLLFIYYVVLNKEGK